MAQARSHLEDFVLFGLSPQGFKNASARGRFPHPYKECFFLLPNRCGISQSTPLRGPASSLALVPFFNQCGIPNPPPFGASVLAGTLPRVYTLRGSASSLAHCPVSGSDTICDSPSPPLADIILFGLSLLGFPSSF